MDVIGDVEVPALRGVDEIRKAQEQAERGRSIGLAAWTALLLSLGTSIYVAAKAVELQRELVGPWTFYPPGTLVILVFAAFALLTRSFYHLWESHHKKNRLLRYLQEVDQFARADALSHSKFIAAFRPPQGEVDRILTAAAFIVLKEHEQQVKFYAQGAGDYGKQRVHADPEDEAYRLRVAFDAHGKQLNMAISKALHDFRYTRDLAKAHEYKVYDSWKEYIPPDILPRQLKKGRSAPGGAVHLDGAIVLGGANDPPDTSPFERVGK